MNNFKRMVNVGLAVGIGFVAASAVSVWAQAGKDNPKPHVEAQVAKLEWKRVSDPDTAYQSAGTLTVVKGTTLIFRAIKDNPQLNWSTGYPKWSGIVPAGNDKKDVVSVPFPDISTNKTNFKAVTVEGSNHISQTANNVVAEVSVSLIPDEDFPGRSQTKLGLSEQGTVLLKISPDGVTKDSIGQTAWSMDAQGGISENGHFVPIVSQSKTITIKVKFEDGPSADTTVELPVQMVAPASFIHEDSGLGKFHVQDTWSAGLKVKTFVGPSDVSFRGIEFIKSDYFHAPSEGWIKDAGIEERPIFAGFSALIGAPSSRGSVVDGFDDVFTPVLEPGVVSNGIITPPYAPGSASAYINYFYKVSDSPPNYFNAPQQEMTSDANGKAEISRYAGAGGQVVSASAVPDEATQYPFEPQP